MPSPKPSPSANVAAFGSASSTSVNPDISLWSGAPITVHATLVLILAYILAHNCTKNAAEDLLNLINMLLFKPNNFPSSLYLFYKHLNIDTLEPVKLYFCKLCETPIPEEENLCPSCHQEKQHYFFELPLEQQIQRSLRDRIPFNIYSIDLKEKLHLNQPLQIYMTDMSTKNFLNQMV